MQFTIILEMGGNGGGSHILYPYTSCACVCASILIVIKHDTQKLYGYIKNCVLFYEYACVQKKIPRCKVLEIQGGQKGILHMKSITLKILYNNFHIS